jgi:putative acyl-CoA dehydrogenase
MTVSPGFDTHEVLNQSPPFVDVNLFMSDRPLQDTVAANGARNEAPALSTFGRHWGAADKFEQARLANENRPKLKTFDDK